MEVLESVGDAKSVAIFGCTNCANMCIAYEKGISHIGTASFFGIKYTPHAVIQEANRIKED